jgi:acetyl esterase/lipase
MNTWAFWRARFVVARALLGRLQRSVPILSLLLALAPGAVGAVPASRQQVPLWPGTAPGTKHVALTETITERSSDPNRPDRFVSGVVQPKLMVFAARQPNGAALLIAPGGGYVREVLDKESFEIAEWMSARGVTAFVLTYRLPGEGHERSADVPLQDAQRATRLVRARAAEWGIDATRIGFMGFSAGGHVAASVATRPDEAVYERVDSIDTKNARPDFSILLYPVISMDPNVGHSGSRKALLGDSPSDAQVLAHSADRRVTARTPPTLMILASDDTLVVPEHSLRYYRALHQAGVSAELHIYAAGKHGFGIRGAAGLPIGGWPDVAWSWLQSAGFVPKLPKRAAD